MTQRIVLSGLLVLILSACGSNSATVDDVDDEPTAATASPVSDDVDAGFGTDNGIGTSPSFDEDLRMICDRWEYYVCTLPNSLPTLCRYCVCGHFGPELPSDCDK